MVDVSEVAFDLNAVGKGHTRFHAINTLIPHVCTIGLPRPEETRIRMNLNLMMVPDEVRTSYDRKGGDDICNSSPYSIVACRRISGNIRNRRRRRAWWRRCGGWRRKPVM